MVLLIMKIEIYMKKNNTKTSSFHKNLVIDRFKG